MRTAPVVQEGLRAGRGAPGRVTPEGDRSDPGLYARISALLRGKNLIVEKAERTPYEVIFAAKNSAHRVQVTAPDDQIDFRTGRKTRGRPIAVQFRNNLYSVPKKHPKEEAEGIIAWLRSHPGYKIDFWEQQDMVNEGKILQAVRTVEAIQKDPTLRETVLDFLTTSDFVEDETKVEGALGSIPLGEGGGEGGDGDLDEDFPDDAEDETGDNDPPPAEDPEPPPPPAKAKKAAPKGKSKKK